MWHEKPELWGRKKIRRWNSGHRRNFRDFWSVWQISRFHITHLKCFTGREYERENCLPWHQRVIGQLLCRIFWYRDDNKILTKQAWMCKGRKVLESNFWKLSVVMIIWRNRWWSWGIRIRCFGKRTVAWRIS